MTFNDIANRLDILIRLTAMGLCVEKSQKEKIELLNSAGLQPKQIADLIGTTSNTVSVTLAGLRKQRKKSP
jgi:DNA-binding CsgD family transcriptional regulator